MKIPRHILPLIVIAQFLCTSLWFAGNAVMPELMVHFNLGQEALGHLTTLVQLGFITGTLTFALLTITDRYSPSRVFFISALLGAFFNLGTILDGNTWFSLMIFRFLTGFFLAGIYPVGMKIAADYFNTNLSRSLGFLVGALVIGTALPHLLKSLSFDLHWRTVLILTSLLATIGGGLIILFVKNGPYRQKSQKPDFTAFLKVFQNKDFRSAAFGYFGHMWELYAFWTFVPVILGNYLIQHQEVLFNSSELSFWIIGLGGLSCVVAGYLSTHLGTKSVAFYSLLLSGICCLISPFILNSVSPQFLTLFLILWGLVVVSDSPMFSSLVARNASPETKGTALTIVNCIGFSITIASIQLLTFLQTVVPFNYLYLILVIGPFFGLISLSGKSAPDLKTDQF